MRLPAAGAAHALRRRLVLGHARHVDGNTGLSLAAGQQTMTEVPASSVIANVNGRLRSYFFLRRQLGHDHQALLPFFLNHRRFLRSEHPEGVGKGPTELLTARLHPHGLELLGYQPCSRNGQAESAPSSQARVTETAWSVTRNTEGSNHAAVPRSDPIWGPAKRVTMTLRL
jgi:hypothetical protein